MDKNKKMKGKCIPDVRRTTDTRTNSIALRKNRKETSARLQRFLVKTALILAGTVLLFTCVFSIRRAKGNTMSPFVRDGDLCIFLKLEQPALGDVVLYLDEDGAQRIGRIAAVGGQTVDFPESGGYTVDGYTPTEEIPYETWQAEDSAVEYPLELSDDQFFIMNDFRSLTGDSRTFGAVDRDQIRGNLLFLLRRRGF